LSVTAINVITCSENFPIDSGDGTKITIGVSSRILSEALAAPSTIQLVFGDKPKSILEKGFLTGIV
jgi:hypothetical protein